MRMKNPKDPIIIIGMHRSGTTMLTKMMQNLGLFIGWNVNDEYEARYFLNRNEKILNGCGGSWDNPVCIENLTSRPELSQKVVSTLEKDLSGIGRVDFLGKRYFFKNRSIVNLSVPWGWKDPRNTFLLPLWLEIFPNAKLLHIYRNGLDIANSLSVRENKRVTGAVQDNKKSLESFISGQKTQLDKSDLFLFISKKVRDNLVKLNPLNKYDDFRVQTIISPEKGFELWNLYIERAFAMIEKYPNPSLSIKYEDFLLDAKKYLIDVCKFCEVDCDETQLNETASRVNSTRRFAFKNNKTLVDLYNNVKSNYWMEKLGYNLDLENS